MGVGIYLKGHSDHEDWTGELRALLSELAHPAAEGITVSDEGVVSARTTPVGPGYHIALCQALDRAAEKLQIAWDDDSGDDTGYFRKRDPRDVEQHMLQWLQTLARVACEKDPNGWALCLPLDHEFRFEGVATPLGPRSVEWLRTVAEDARNGIDFFPWWSPGENAAALLGRARCLMWTQMRWRMPTYQAEEELEDELLDLLQRAWALDPTLDYPAREWCTLPCDVPDAIHARAQKATGPLIGYRRNPVRVRFPGGWSVEIPGEFSEEWDDDTWSAWHDGRTVWFSGYSKDKPAAELVEAAPSEGEVLRLKDGDVLKKAYLAPGDDGFILSTRNAVDGKLAVMSVVYPSESEREWALRIWESLRSS